MSRQLLVLACLLPLVTWGQDAPERDLDLELELTLEERRHALIIGNDHYPSGPLLNAGNDARSMELALSELGFETLLLENSRLIDLDRSVRRFASRIGRNSVALVFYAGHGFQIDGENYIVPIDFSGDEPEEVKYTSYAANKLLDILASRDPKLLLVVLDACRNNPFSSARGMGGGLASMGAGGKGTFIALATAPGSTASDNPNGSNGLFTTALLKHMKRKGMGLTETFDEVKREVSILSGDAQRPWTNSDFAGRWYFSPPDDYLPEEIDPTTSLRLLEEARRMQGNQFYTEAANLYDRLAAREKDSPLGALAAQEAGYWRAFTENWPAVGSEPEPAELAPKLKSIWESIPARAQVGLEAANNFLLAGSVAEAAEILGRLRGADQETAFRATEMLQELAKDFPEAATASKARFTTLPADPLGLEPESRFEALAAKLEADRAAKRRSAAENPSALVPLSGVQSNLPPPSIDGWIVRIESMIPPEEPVAAGLADSTEIAVDAEASKPEEPTADAHAEEIEEGDVESGEVFISSVPSEAHIEIDGQLLDLRTPAQVSLAPGDYAISFWEGDIRVKRAQRLSVSGGRTLVIKIESH